MTPTFPSKEVRIKRGRFRDSLGIKMPEARITGRRRGGPCQRWFFKTQ
jgi:hypothetical protein